MYPAYTKLKGVYDFSESLLCDQLEANLITFFSWGLLNIGAFANVKYHGASPYIQDASRLRPISDKKFNSGQLWEGFRNDWIWESGVDYPVQPIPISGVYVNGTFYAGNHPTYGHKIDYPHGRIIFNNPISLNSVVNIEYSFRYYNIQSADAEWFREIMFNSFRVDDSKFLQYGSGVAEVLAQDHIQLPAIVVEVVPRRTFYGSELGGGQYINQDVLFHVFTENPWDRKKLLDIITYQNDRTLWLFDKNIMAQQDRYPLDYNGSIRPGAITYPVMVLPSGQNGFAWKKATFINMSSIESISAPPLYQAVVRATINIEFPEL
jgi:hypothetical protein